MIGRDRICRILCALGLFGLAATPAAGSAWNAAPLAVSYQQVGPLPGPPRGHAAPAGQDRTAEVAALLAAADTAPDAATRNRIVEQLDALGVRLAEGAGGDDPLSGWRQADKNGSQSPWRGRALGPAYRRVRVGAGESLTIEQIFLAGQRARIAAQTTGGSGVALAISNPRSEAVCTRQLAPAGSCQFLPLYTERFAIRLHNRGRQAVSIYLVFR